MIEFQYSSATIILHFYISCHKERRVKSAGYSRHPCPSPLLRPMSRQDLKQLAMEEGLNPKASDSGLSFVIPAGDGLKPQVPDVNIASRITKPRRLVNRDTSLTIRRSANKRSKLVTWVVSIDAACGKHELMPNIKSKETNRMIRKERSHKITKYA